MPRRWNPILVSKDGIRYSTARMGFVLTCYGGNIISSIFAAYTATSLPEVIHAGRLTEAEFFYDALRKGRLAVDSIHYPDYRKAYGKALVLHEILSLPIGVEVIVDSDKSSIDYFYGNDHWCLGLDAYHDTNRIDSSFSDGFVHYPKSVRKQSVSARRRESGNAYRVLSITIVDNR